MTSQIAAAPGLTDEKCRIVEWGDGPLVVIAGAGTGRRASSSNACAGSWKPAAPPRSRRLVLTYAAGATMRPSARSASTPAP